MAWCGDSCTLSGSAFGSVKAHRYVLELASNEIDTRIFGDAAYGSFIACAKNGSLTIDSYKRPDVDVGDTLSVLLSVGDAKITVPGVCTSQSINVDAKDVVQFSTKMRVIDDATWSA